MLLLGLCAIMSDHYYLTSNREVGEGRFDLQLMPRDMAAKGVQTIFKYGVAFSGKRVEITAK